MRENLHELGDQRNAVRAHGEMNAALGQRAGDAAVTVNDVRQRLVILHHGDDDVAEPGGVGDGLGQRRAAADQIGSLRFGSVENRELMSGAKDAIRHCGAHLAETDETDLHIPFLQIQNR